MREIKTIKEITTQNGFKPEIVDRIERNVKLKNALKQVIPVLQAEDEIYRTLTYYGNVSIKIKRIAENIGIKVVLKCPTNLGRHLFNGRSRAVANTKSGVYRMNCGTCEGVYIGQAGRNFQVRKQEHLRSLRLKKSDSTYANHILEPGHLPNNSLEILHIAPKGRKLINILEGLEIFGHGLKPNTTVLNDQQEAFEFSF